MQNTLTLYLKIEPSLIFVNKHVFDVAHCLQLLKCLLRRECAPLTKRHQYIFSVSLKFGAYYITDQLREVIKNVTCFFFIIKFVFLSFSFHFFDEVSNFRNRILTNQKRELMVSNCQWNCMAGRFPKEHKVSIFKVMTLEKLTCRTDKSIDNSLLLSQLPRSSVMLRHVLNYQHTHVHLV